MIAAYRAASAAAALVSAVVVSSAPVALYAVNLLSGDKKMS
jgi:hypothetical protein